MSSLSEQIEAFVEQKIHWLTEINSEAVSKSSLAKLRRGIGKSPGSIPELWEITLENMPDMLMGNRDEPSYAEWAVHASLSLFALHQQGKDLKNSQQMMNKKGISLGAAARMLVKDEDGDLKRVKRRFDVLATSQNMPEFTHHLRNLVQLLKASDIPLDYGKLASDIFRFQFSNNRDRVKLEWGRDFYRVPHKQNQTESK